MKRLALAVLLLTAVVTSGILLARPGAEASPATYTVNSTADPGDGTCDGTECTLREAIAAANADAGTDTIEFNIPGLGPHTIQPTSALPIISQPVVIDGTSEPDFAGTPIIELDGTNAGLGAQGLWITAGSTTVKGLVINRFAERGIVLSLNGSNVIQGNYIGTDVTGTADLGNNWSGVKIVHAANNTIGGTAAGARNVISGNDYDGVRIKDGGATGNLVQGNYIGTDKNGTAALGNSGDGVDIWAAPGNMIGGTAAGARNVISGNDQHGVYIWTSGATGNHVQGNLIGTDITGAADLGNSSSGVMISSAPSNTIGGTAAGAGNVISSNGEAGIAIWNGEATGNLVQGNYIGTDVTGTADLGNSGDGVDIWAAPGNMIGGTAAGARNVISGNDYDGVVVLFDTGNTISGNSIHSNGGQGIDNGFGGNGEPDDPAPPVIDTVASASGHTDPTCYPCTVEVFSDDEDEGRIYHGFTTTNNDATGTWTYTGAVTGPNITATVTHADGNTSEFSAPVAYSPPPPVGGIAELPDVSGSAGRNYAALAGLAATALFALSAGAWYARRRCLG